MNYLIPTIDVEALRSLTKLGSFDQLILGKVGDEQFGTLKIAEILKDFGGTGTFYIDFAEHGHGIEKLKNLSEKLLSVKQDVQLHIHPQFIADNKRFLMNQYSRSEQKQIFDNCIDIFEKCTGELPNSFRAGGYGADDNTLSILSEMNIPIDTSYFRDHEWCNISEQPVNKVSVKDNLFEIPVTVFNNNISYGFTGINIKSKTRIKKLDVDGCTKSELVQGFDILKNSGVRIIVIFLHSFSLFNKSYDYKSIAPDYNDIDKFQFILDYAQKSGYQISSVKNISHLLSNYLEDPSLIPSINTSRNILKSSVVTADKKIRKIFRGK